MYKLILKIEGAPKVAVVIFKPEEFKEEMQEKLDNKELKKQFKDPENSLKIVVVCDMWLTGFDVPPLHTMYLDKPLKNHTLMQAIARVNRIFKDKPGGLIVDYIGIADNLKKALSIYSADIRKEAMIPLQKIIDKMNEKYNAIKSMFNSVDWTNNEIIKLRIRANVRLLLLRNRIFPPESEKILDSVFHQAFLLYRDWIPA